MLLTQKSPSPLPKWIIPGWRIRHAGDQCCALLVFCLKISFLVFLAPFLLELQSTASQHRRSASFGRLLCVGVVRDSPCTVSGGVTLAVVPLFASLSWLGYHGCLPLSVRSQLRSPSVTFSKHKTLQNILYCKKASKSPIPSLESRQCGLQGAIEVGDDYNKDKGKIFYTQRGKWPNFFGGEKSVILFFSILSCDFVCLQGLVLLDKVPEFLWHQKLLGICECIQKLLQESPQNNWTAASKKPHKGLTTSSKQL